jgi:response regulator RpfG family c-di-GMP phosphodiesterase
MLAENPPLAENPTPQPLGDSINAPMDMVVLVVPDHGGLSHEFVDAIAEMRRRGDAAVLVVFPRVVDTEVILRAEAAGASHCVVAPTSEDLFKHIERARALRRHAVAEEDPLDALWRARSQHD